jgi:DNA-binding response OmpR family regulator
MSITTQAHIAVVDDEADIRQLLSTYLGSHGFRVSALPSGTALFAIMDNDAPQVVLLDLGLPGEDGLSIARQLRERWHCGLLIVTGRGDPVDKVVGLELGADDYVTKPFDLRELLARTKAVLRRIVPPVAQTAEPALAPRVPANTCGFLGWTCEVAARRLLMPTGQEVSLTGGEFDLLVAFLKHPGRVLSRDFLLEHTRGREAGPFNRTIDVQIGRLRKKLEEDPQDPKIIKSVRGAGYVFVPNVTAS